MTVTSDLQLSEVLNRLTYLSGFMLCFVELYKCIANFVWIFCFNDL